MTDRKQMSRVHSVYSLVVSVAVGAMLSILAPQVSVGRPQKTPVPEYFGIYVIDNGNLASLHEGKSSYQPPASRINLYSMASGGFAANAQEFSSKLHFLVFNANPAELAHNLYLYRLGFVRSFIQGNMDQALNPLVFGKENSNATPINSWLSGRLPNAQIPLLSKPVTGQTQIIEETPSGDLSPGVYALFHAQEHWYEVFTIAGSDMSGVADCVDISFQTGGFGGPMVMGDYYSRYGPPAFPEITVQHYKSCATQPATVGQTPGNTNSQPSISTLDCSLYRPCMDKGNESFSRQQWDQAISYYQKASTLSPSEGGPWGAMAGIYVASNQYQKLLAAGDKVFSLNSSMTIPVCHGRTMQYCEKGDFVIGPKEIWFAVNGRKVFGADPAQVKSKGTLDFSQVGQAHISFAIAVQGKRYNFDFIPFIVTCQIQLSVQCPQEGMQQQLLMANFIAQAIPKLSTKTVLKSEAQATSGNASGSASSPRCNEAKDSGYSLLSSGHLYTVRNLDSATGSIHVFMDDKAAAVTDHSLLQQLALGAWTRDNIVASASTRAEINSKPGVIKAIAGTLQSIQRYEMVQDVLARAMATALEAGVTKGLSLPEAVPKLAGSFVRSQFSKASAA